MLTCTPVADSATADSADTWRVITLRISSSYPTEPPSVVVRMSRDAQLAPQVTTGVSVYLPCRLTKLPSAGECMSRVAQQRARLSDGLTV